MFRDAFLLIYCAATGFVASGVAASFYKMMTLESPRFALLGQGWLAAFATFLFCAVTGPIIVIDLVLRGRLNQSSAVGTVLAGVFIAGLWSICSGILVLGAVLSIRDTLV
ncbi:MAG TPA: hypothetical protein VG894_10610 [Bauldia sp.]|nr:hypothetical protein [Bauldia sp.]